MSDVIGVCHVCFKEVTMGTLSPCGICSKPVCRSCETLLGNMLLCAECKNGDTFHAAVQELRHALDELKAAMLEAIVSLFKGKE